jgi:hypothetical protein
MVVSETQVQQVQNIPISIIDISIKVYKDNSFYWADIDIDNGMFKWTYGPKMIALSYTEALDKLLYAIRSLSDIREKILVHSNFENLLIDLTEALASVLMYIHKKED